MDNVTFPEKVRERILKIRSMFGPYNSYHEAYGVILEELDEFWDIVKQKEYNRDDEETLSELLDVAACCQRAAEDFGLCRTDSVSDQKKLQLHTERQSKIETLLGALHIMMANRKNPLPPLQKGEQQRYSLEYTDTLLKDIEDALAQ